MITLKQGDCIKLMQDIPDKSVDMVLCDLPYSMTALDWDCLIPFNELWGQYNRVIKDNGAIVLFSKQPFTTKLIMSNMQMFKYTLVWVKDNHDNPMMAKKRFLNITEDICVFYKQQPTYNPQGIREVNKVVRQGRGESLSCKEKRAEEYTQTNENYPTNILSFARDNPQVHPTQKPVELLKYLIRTFTNENELVLDNTMGSGSTGVACVQTNRSFIGMELNTEYFELAKSRIETCLKNKSEGLL